MGVRLAPPAMKGILFRHRHRPSPLSLRSGPDDSVGQTFEEIGPKGCVRIRCSDNTRTVRVVNPYDPDGGTSESFGPWGREREEVGVSAPDRVDKVKFYQFIKAKVLTV